VIDDEGDELDEEQRRALNAAIEKSLEQAAAGRAAPSDDVLAALRARRRG
jgi:predicted transcriptional regulator